MTPSEFATFKYQHSEGTHRSKPRVVVTAACLAGAALSSALSIFPLGIVLLVIAAIAWFSSPRQLLLGPRYLLCGNSIVYFGNVKQMDLSAAQGKLRLECKNGAAFVLERDKFPTSARKANKIAKNKAAKFDKVSSKIMEKVRAATANAVRAGKSK